MAEYEATMAMADFAGMGDVSMDAPASMDILDVAEPSPQMKAEVSSYRVTGGRSSFDA